MEKHLVLFVFLLPIFVVNDEAIYIYLSGSVSECDVLWGRHMQLHLP